MSTNAVSSSEAPGLIVAPCGGPPVSATEAAAFDDALGAAKEAAARRKPKIDGDIDGDGHLNDAEKLVLAIRAMIRELQQQMVMLATDGRLSQDQSQRLRDGMKSLGQLAANITADVQDGTPLSEDKLKQLRGQATQIMSAALSSEPADEHPVPMVGDREIVRAEAELHDHLLAKLEAGTAHRAA
jgi:hypothetical protein